MKADGKAAAHEPVGAHDEELDLLALEPSPPALKGGEALVARCLSLAHPVLHGRVLCELTTAEGVRELWAPALRGLAIREGDHVLLSQPSNWLEPLVVGVVDGHARRPEAARAPAARLALARDETLVVEGAEGQPLVELRQAEEGPVVRLLQHDVHLELEGALRVSARSIALAARAGEARIEATSDVVVSGEAIRLN
jgi:hypothetical protein